MIKTWYYTCDGGVNPAHHQPAGCSIEFDGEFYEVWIGSSKYKNRSYGTMQQALGILNRRYDKVFLRSEKTCEYTTYTESIPVKDEPIRYRDQHPAYEQPIKKKKKPKGTWTIFSLINCLHPLNW